MGLSKLSSFPEQISFENAVYKIKKGTAFEKIYPVS
jgi:hypothetical protein